QLCRDLWRQGSYPKFICLLQATRVYGCAMQITERNAGAEAEKPAARETSRSLMVALMRILQLIKRVQSTSVEPALVWVLHVVDATQPVRLSELAGHMYLDISTASRHVKALEDSGHIQRTVDPDDRRAALISLTDEGREVLAACFTERCGRLDGVL